MKSKAKILLLMAISLVFVSVFSISVSAAEVIERGTGSDGTIYNFYSDGTLVVSQNYAILSETSGDDYFSTLSKNWKNVNKVVFDNNTTIIPAAFFKGGEQLTEIVYPSSLQSMYYNAFAGCPKIQSITIPKSVSSVPASLTGGHLGNELYHTCIKNIYVEDGNKHFQSIDGVLFSKDGKTLVRYPDGRTETTYVIPEGVTGIDDGAFSGCVALTKIIMPDSIKSIGGNAFYVCVALKEITVPDSVSSIDWDAFAYCSALKKATIYNKTTTFGSGVFGGCSFDFTLYGYAGSTTEEYAKNNNINFVALDEEIKPESNIVDSGKCGDNLTYTLTDDGVLTISGSGDMYNWQYPSHVPWNFYTSYIRGAKIGDNVTSIGDAAFSVCDALTEITIPDSVTRIGDRAFYDCDALESVTLGSGVETIGIYAFWSCSSLTEITIPDSVTSIGYSAFYSCDALTEITIPDSVTIIGSHAFYECDSLTEITIPNSVINIGSYAFIYCDALKKVTIYNKTTKFDGSGVFSDCPSDLTLYGYIGSTTEEYAKANGHKFVALTGEPNPEPNIIKTGKCGDNLTWTLYPDGKLTISGTGTMPDFEAGKAPWYAYADKIHTVVIEDGITSIGACAFYGCRNIYSLSLPGSITSIGYAAFHSCCGLSGFIVPQNVTAIGDYAFFGCTGLEYVTLYPGISYIGAHAFDGCTGLERINLPDTITYIGDYAFSGCVRILEIVIPVGVTELRPYVFNMCTGLVKVVIHSKVEIIDYTSFCGCICHIHGYNESYAQKYAQGLKIVFVPLKFIWAENSEWGTEELKKADELQLFPENLKEKDLSQSITREEFAAVAVKVYERLTGTSVLPSIVNPFTDTNNIDVLKAYNAGITTGVSETQFAPNALLNREQAATMLTRVFKKATIPGWNVGEDANYPLVYDVPPAFWDDADISSWAKESVYFMVANGIVSGVGNNMFAPRNTTTEHEAIAYANATREQALIIAVRMIEKLSK